MIHIRLIILGVMFSAIAGAAWYWKWSQDQLKTLLQNNTELKQAADTANSTIVTLQQGYRNAQQLHNQTTVRFNEIKQENNVLHTKLAKHRIGFLAEKKPGLIKNITNGNTKNMFRCFEIVYGSPLTSDELGATKKSQSNTTCPSLANPNFKENP